MSDSNQPLDVEEVLRSAAEFHLKMRIKIARFDRCK